MGKLLKIILRALADWHCIDIQRCHPKKQGTSVATKTVHF